MITPFFVPRAQVALSLCKVEFQRVRGLSGKTASVFSGDGLASSDVAQPAGQRAADEAEAARLVPFQNRALFFSSAQAALRTGKVNRQRGYSGHPQNNRPPLRGTRSTIFKPQLAQVGRQYSPS